MQEWQLFTWNTQGDFTNAFKLAEIDGLCAGPRVVGFVQEGGVRKGGDQGRWIAHGGTGVGAYNERCTNYVLVDATYARFVSVESLILQNGEGAAVVGGGDAGRTPAAVGVGNVLFISWHSLSGRSNADTAAVVQAIESNAGYRESYDTVVIGGDFNAAPADIEGVVTRGTARSRAAWTYRHRYVLSSGEVTHPGSDTELDFFVILSKTEWSARGVLANYRGIERRILAPSDHHAVRMKIFV